MKNNIKLVAVDIDGTFVRSDYTYDIPRFQRILSRMKEAGCHFVIASGNQYYQLRDLFPGCHEELAFVAENGAFVKDRKELVFAAEIPKETVDFVLDVCGEYPEIWNVLCGLDSAYCQRGMVSQAFFERTLLPPFAVGGRPESGEGPNPKIRADGPGGKDLVLLRHVPGTASREAGAHDQRAGLH